MQWSLSDPYRNIQEGEEFEAERCNSHPVLLYPYLVCLGVLEGCQVVPGPRCVLAVPAQVQDVEVAVTGPNCQVPTILINTKSTFDIYDIERLKHLVLTILFDIKFSSEK